MNQFSLVISKIKLVYSIKTDNWKQIGQIRVSDKLFFNNAAADSHGYTL